eukprot:gene5113-6364_t
MRILEAEVRECIKQYYPMSNEWVDKILIISNDEISFQSTVPETLKKKKEDIRRGIEQNNIYFQHLSNSKSIYDYDLEEKEEGYPLFLKIRFGSGDLKRTDSMSIVDNKGESGTSISPSSSSNSSSSSSSQNQLREYSMESGTSPSSSPGNMDTDMDDFSTHNPECGSPNQFKLKQIQIMDRLKNVLVHLVRDWSVEGQEERSDCYDPILNELKKIYEGQNRENIKILIPGGGLGRLSYDIACLGFFTELNEESMFMIIPTFHVLLSNLEPFSFTIQPFIHQTKNVYSSLDQTREIKIPDTLINKKVIQSGNFVLSPGDFFDYYKDVNSIFDSVCTCFFIDTVPNIMEALEIIFSVLKPGGFWINNGPLHYHHPATSSVHLTQDELMSLIESFGFEIIKIESIDCKYTQNIKSMLQLSFKGVFFVARKPLSPIDPSKFKSKSPSSSSS